MAMRLGIYPNFGRYRLGNFATSDSRSLKNNDFIELARPVHSSWHGPDGRVRTKKCKKGYPMFNLASVRETATIFAGAFVSALLLISAATSLPIA